MRPRAAPTAIVAFALLSSVPGLAQAGVPVDPGRDSAAQAFAALRFGSSGWGSHRHHPAVKVDDDGAQCPDAPYTTIQDAVDAGAGKILVCAGTYPENVVIPAGAKLSIEGYGHGEAKVTGAARPTAGPIIDVEPGSKVTLRKLTIDGESTLDGSTVTGIRFDEASGTIERLKILNIRNASGSSQGFGVRVQSSGPKTKVTVTKSLIKNYTRGGVSANGDGVDVKVTYSTVIGPELPRVWAPNGIQISRDARGQVVRNKVDSNISPNPNGGAGSGILVFCADRTSVERNTVTGGDIGIGLADTDKARVQRNDISGTNFEGISLQLLGLFFGPLGCTPEVSPVENNFVSDNKVHDNLLDGIAFSNFDPSGQAPDTPNDNKIYKNYVKNNGSGGSGDGIHVYTGTENRFYRNKVSGSDSGTNAVDDSSGSGTAGTANRWIANACQPSVPAGICAY